MSDGMPGFATRAIHAGQEPDPVTGAVVVPISLATTFAQSGVGEHAGYEYSRSGNPTRTAYETCVASLEEAQHGLAFASGLAAEDAVLRLLDPGDRVVLGNDAGAPKQSRIGLKLVINTFVALAVWFVVFLIDRYDLIRLQ